MITLARITDQLNANDGDRGGVRGKFTNPLRLCRETLWRMINMSNTRDAYVEKMKAKLDEWNSEIAKLEAKAKQNEADARMQFGEQVETLKKKRQATERDLDKLRNASENAWADLKVGVENAASSLGDAIRSAQSRFNS
jgi:uncharacterized membrane-anchored protein